MGQVVDQGCQTHFKTKGSLRSYTIHKRLLYNSVTIMYKWG